MHVFYSSNSLCLIYFSVRTKMSTTEIFIIVDDNVTSESSRIFNVTMYANAEVNIAARNGQWSLSKDYLEPRVFKRVRR